MCNLIKNKKITNTTKLRYCAVINFAANVILSPFAFISWIVIGRRLSCVSPWLYKMLADCPKRPKVIYRRVKSVWSGAFPERNGSRCETDEDGRSFVRCPVLERSHVTCAEKQGNNNGRPAEIKYRITIIKAE